MKLSPALHIDNVDHLKPAQYVINGKPLFALPGGLFCLSKTMKYTSEYDTKYRQQVVTTEEHSTESRVTGTTEESTCRTAIS